MATHAHGVAFHKVHFAARIGSTGIDEGIIQRGNTAPFVAHNDAVGYDGLGKLGGGIAFNEIVISTPLLAIKLAHGDGAPIEVGWVGGVAPVESGVESQLVALHQIADAARLHGVGQAGLGLAGFGRLRDTP